MSKLESRENMFQKNVVEFSIKNINMIGNCNNGSIIGLSPDGHQFVQKIKASHSFDEIEKIITGTKDRTLYIALKEQGYFENCTEKRMEAAYFHLNNDCNLHCLGCYSHNSERNHGNNMTYEEICIALRKMKELGINDIIISGGEPFLREDIYEILKYIKESLEFQSVQVITNGTITNMYDPIRIAKYVDELNISIDGFSKTNSTYIRDKGIYDTIFGNIDKLKQNGICLKLIATLHRQNIDFAGEYIKLSQRIDIPVSFSILTCSGDFEEFEKWLPTEEQLKRYGYGEIKGLDKVYSEAKGTDFILMARKTCGMGQRLISISNTGDIYPCHMAQLPFAILGNILRDSNSDIRRNCAEFAAKVDVDNIESCLECEYKYVCGGGCRARALTLHQDAQAADDYCVISKTYFETVFDHLAQEISEK